MALAPVQEGEVTRDPEWERRWDAAQALAKRDVEMDHGPRSLTGELAEHQDIYDDMYAELLGSQIAAREPS